MCDDFNDLGLRHHFVTITNLTQLKRLIDFNTRGDNCVDQIFSNFLLLAALITSLFRGTLLQSYVSLISKRNVVPGMFSPANFARFFEVVSNYITGMLLAFG